MNHRNIALVETPELPAPPADGTPPTSAISHIAIALPGREAWQLAFPQRRAIKFERRVEHGMTHGLYIRAPNGYSFALHCELPRAVWGGDIQAALNHYVALPTKGAEAQQDGAENLPVFARPGAD